VHRTKTRFAARINHVASALEKRGVRATYTLHDRVLANRSSRRHFAGSAPELDDVQQRIVDELVTDGYCVVPFSDVIAASIASFTGRPRFSHSSFWLKRSRMW